ncbi:MAG: hypothetical protein ACRDHW_11300 [Ktedonobacteraceae bacterium]
MAQHNKEHLTITQLSAYLDQAMASDELELCAAHVQLCQPCQSTLTDLRLTSSLLHGMSQVEVPYSFALPANFAVLPVTPTSEGQLARRWGRGPYIAKRTLRALSTIAAMIGLIFILLGAFSTVSHMGNNAASMTAPRQTAGSAHNAATATNQRTLEPHSTSSTRDTATGSASTSTQTPAPSPTASGSPTPTLNNGLAPGASQPTLPLALDPGQPEGRLSIGATLLLLGILGLLWTRRRVLDS